MGKVISVANQKGGVGKTTTAVNISAGLSALGKRVLLADCDPQANATSGLGIDYHKLTKTVCDGLVDDMDAREIIVKTPYCDVLPSNIELAGADMMLSGKKEREKSMRTLLAPVVFDYDYIIIDCPPSLGLLTICALTASDSVIAPIQCEYYALEGLTQLMSTIRTIQHVMNENLEIEGILMTMFDSRANLSAQVCSEVKKHFGKLVYPVVIPRNVRLSEAPSHGKPVMYYDKNSRGAESYKKLCEIIVRNP